jgi:hypothetical protein
MVDKNNEYKIAVKRASDLQSQRKEVLGLPPEKAIDRILDAKHPAALIHSFPEEDLYFLVNDIGINDSLEILALASDRQWEYLLDVELWEKDRIDTDAATRWFNMLFQAAPKRFIKWAVEKKEDFVEYYLYKNIMVAAREHDQDPSDFGEGFITFDDVYYIKILENPEYEFSGQEAEPEKEEEGKTERGEFIIKMLEKIAEYDYEKYRRMLFESSSLLGAEMEEEFYRLRNIRLAEKGFLPFHEAAGIYSPLKPEKLVERKKVSKRKKEEFPLVPVPLYSFGMLKGENLFTMSLKRISADESLKSLQIEFASLCNRIIAADYKNIKSKDELKEVVGKACGYLSIGLERLSDINQSHLFELIEKYDVFQIFRNGFGAALELKERAGKWIKKAWFTKAGLPLSFWGEEWMGVLGGLLIKKPLYFDNYRTGRIYREFEKLREIKEAEAALEDIIALDALLSLLNPDASKVNDRFFNHKKLLFTLFARFSLGLPNELSPIPYDDFFRFYGGLWTGKGKVRRIGISIKESFLGWLTEMTGLAASELTDRFGMLFEGLFGELEDEYKKVAKHDLDPRYITLFLVEKKS